MMRPNNIGEAELSAHSHFSCGIYPSSVMFNFHWHPPSHCRGSHHWERCYGGQIPQDAVHGGQDLDGGPIYVGRAYHDGDLLPAKVCPRHGCAFISYAGEEIRKHEYEVLRSSHCAWKEDRDGRVPPEAIRVGHTVTGEGLYVGRVFHNGILTVGKIHPSHGCLYIPFDGREVRFYSYEVLVLC